MAPIHHIGLYTFKASFNAAAIEESTKKMLTLKDRCLHPTTGKPYILSMTAGPNLIPDSAYAGGYTHALMMTFANEEDWQYYVKKDPVHIEFIHTNQDWEIGCVMDIKGEEQ